MGSVFRRGNKLWLKYKTVGGKWVNKPAELNAGREREAALLLKKTEARIKARVDAGETESDGPITVARYTKAWLERRTTATANDDMSRLKTHALPAIGKLKLDEVRPRHVRELVRTLATSGKLAPRSVRNVYGVLHTMFHDAHVEELIESNPCVLKRGDLPKKIDKDPTWRPGAVFAREEVEALISSDKIPEDRRVLYSVLLLAGLRFGEAAALKWSSYDATVSPLGKLVVAASYSIRKKAEKAVKTERPREVPVHSTLAKILAAWKLGGWQRMLGRAPRPADLLIPSREGRNRSVNHSLKRFYEDCDRVGLRRRRQHDLRRTFITLARTDGARRDVLEVITHGPRGNIVDIYTSLPWPLLCEEVAKLRLELLQGQVIELPRSCAAGRSDGAADRFGTVLGTVGSAARADQQKSPGDQSLPGFPFLRGGRDLNPRPPA